MVAAGQMLQARDAQQELLAKAEILYMLAAEAAEVVKRIGAILVVLTLAAEAAEVVALPTEMKCMAALAAQELF
nr:MAG TPA: hypothetical protein [Caudoviricetes sp.]